mmetsp:Transcript_49808/g.114977  ORF Transcript_49808/g.114977 Transcript_49808/m.114977 type:complete len:225 (-) Transcript_49808:1304-1978(-)
MAVCQVGAAVGASGGGLAVDESAVSGACPSASSALTPQVRSLTTETFTVSSVARSSAESRIDERERRRAVCARSSCAVPTRATVSASSTFTFVRAAAALLTSFACRSGRLLSGSTASAYLFSAARASPTSSARKVRWQRASREAITKPSVRYVPRSPSEPSASPMSSKVLAPTSCRPCESCHALSKGMYTALRVEAAERSSRTSRLMKLSAAVAGGAMGAAVDW